MNRAARPSPVAGQPALQPAAERLHALLEPQQRPDDAADQQRAEHDQHRGAGARPSSARAGSSTATAEVPAISSVTRPRASVTRSRVRTGSRLPSEHADGGAEQHRGDVDDGADTGDHGTPRGQLGGAERSLARASRARGDRTVPLLSLEAGEA